MSAEMPPQFTPDAHGLAKSGDIAIEVLNRSSPIFIWKDAVAFGLIVDASLDGRKSPLWEIHSTVGFSSVVSYGLTPQFAELVGEPLTLVPGCRYFVSVYGTYPRYGIQEFVA